jgi:hypothetical protein
VRLTLRRIVTLLAIYAVALHVILLGLAPINANGAAVDPLSLICHSSAPAAPGQEAPDKPDLIPGHACEHCNLCSAVAPPEPDVAFIGNLLPVRVLHILRPASTAPHHSITSGPRLAQGPPSVA